VTDFDEKIDRETLERKKDLLPHMPQVLGELQKRVENGDTDSQTLSELIGSDVGLVGKILRIVNSAYYQLPRKLSDLKFAIAYLGFAEIYRIVLTSSVVEQLKVDGDDFERFWRHSFFTALVARKLLTGVDAGVAMGELWPAALLHDVGELVSMRLFPEEFNLVKEYINQHKCLVSEAEQALDVVAHTALGALLCEHWNLPDTVKDVCLHHENLAAVDISASHEIMTIRKVVMAADRMAKLASMNISEKLQDELRAQICSLLEVDEDGFLLAMAKAYEQREEVDRFLADI